MGFYFLFAPIIALLVWIPLVGQLLGAVMSLAAAIFSVVVGGTIAFAVFGLAWLVFRPLYGIILLACASVGCYFIFFLDASKS